MYRVLIVDDNPIICKALENRILWNDLGLELAGFCHDGNQVPTIVKEKDVHIMITDIRMPIVDGIQAIGQLRSQKIPVQIIIMSGYDDSTYLKKAIDYSVVSYLMKPIQDDEILDSLHKAIERLQEHEKLANFRSTIESLKKRERVHSYTKCLSSLIQTMNPQPSLAIDERHLRSSPHQWLLFASPKNEEHRFTTLEDDCFANAALSVDVIQPVPYLVAVLISSDATSPMHEIESSIRNTLQTNRTAGQSLSSNMFLTAVDMQKQFLVTLTNLYSDIFGGQFSADDRSHNTSPIDKQTLRLHLAASDFSGAAQFVSAKIERYLRERPSVQGLDNLIKTTLQIYTEVVPEFADLTANLYHVSLCSLAFDSVEAIVSLFANSTQFLDNANARIDLMIQYINEHYTEPLKLETLSEKFHYNPIYFGQLIKRHTGMTFHHYLNDLRIRQAIEIMKRSPDIKITELAYQLGFSDKNYFSKIFKKFTGESPSKFC